MFWKQGSDTTVIVIVKKKALREQDKGKTTRHRKLFKGSYLSFSVRLTLLLIYNNSLLKSPNYCTTSSQCHVNLAFLHLI